MPAAIPALVYYAATFVGTSAWFAVAAAAIASYAVSDHQKEKARRQARDAYNASLQDRLVMTATSNGPRSRLYGEVRNVDNVGFKATHGVHSEFYTLVVELAGHECESIEKVYFNDQELTLASDGAGGFWVMTPPFLRGPVESAEASLTTVGTVATVTLPHTPVAGSVQCYQYLGEDPEGGYPLYALYTPSSVVGTLVTCNPVDAAHTSIVCSYQYILDAPKARIWKYLGTDIQDIGADLLESRFPGLVNTPGNDDRFAGICALVVEFEYDQDAYATGLPNVSALVRGAKCYDPRLDSTAGGSGAHRADDPTTWEWTQNPAIIARDWSLYQYGGGCTSDHIDDDAVIAAANACDIETDFETAAGIETRPLYQCDIAIKLGGQPDQDLDEIIESMAGKRGWQGGQLKFVAGLYRAPVLDIGEDMVSEAEELVLVKDQPRADAVNVYRPSFANADVTTDPTTSITHAYTLTSAPEVRAEAYITADGQELPREVTLGGVSHAVHAQHVCAVLMRDSRFAMRLSMPLKMGGWRLQLFDVVRVTLPYFSIAAIEFEVVGWKFSLDKGVITQFKLIDASIFTPDAVFNLPNSEANTSMVLPWVVPEVDNLAVTSGITSLEDGTPQTRAIVSWDASTSASVLQSGKIEVQYSEVGATAQTWFNAPPAEGSATSLTITGLRRGGYYLFRARQVNTLRVRSVWCDHVLHLIAMPPDAAATAAQAAADAALAALDDIASDGLLTPVEKHRVMVEVSVLLAEQTGIDATATAQGITTELTAYDDAVDDLTTYLATLTSPTDWDDVSGNTTVVRATFNGWFEAVYAARQTLLNLIAVTIAEGAVSTTEQEDFGSDYEDYTGAGSDDLTEMVLTDQIEISVTDPGGVVRIDVHAEMTVSGVDLSSHDNCQMYAMLVDTAAATTALASAQQDLKLVRILPATEGPPVTKRARMPVRITRHIPVFSGSKTYRVRFYWLIRDVNGDPPSALNSGLVPTQVLAYGTISSRVLKV